MRSRLRLLFCQRVRKLRTSSALALSQLPQTPVSGPRVMGRASTSNSCTVSFSISGDRCARLVSRLFSVPSMACGICSALTAPSSITGISARRKGRSLLRRIR